MGSRRSRSSSCCCRDALSVSNAAVAVTVIATGSPEAGPAGRERAWRRLSSAPIRHGARIENRLRARTV